MEKEISRDIDKHNKNVTKDNALTANRYSRVNKLYLIFIY